MKVNILGHSDSLINQFLAELRDADIQKDSNRFRFNLERLGQLFAYEISKVLSYEPREVNTQLGSIEIRMIRKQPIIATILRAGLPVHAGLLNYFDKAGNAFVSTYRKVYKDGHSKLNIHYCSSPDLSGETLILADALVATGGTMVLSYKELLTFGTPSHTHLVTILASSEGIDYLKKNLPSKDITVWVGAVDEEMTAQAFLVPGMGDAGDLAFGKKGD
jgi:uracil phosphoribosyltransferase